MEQEQSYWSRRAAGRLTRRRLLGSAALGGSAIAALAVAGCGSSNNKVKATSGAGTATRTATAAGAAPAGASPAAGGSPATGAAPAGSPAAQQPKRGGKIAFPTSGEQPNLDVHQVATTYLQGYGPGAAYSRVVRPKPFGHGGRVVPEPDLAAKWEQPDPATYVFTMRDAARFQNIAPVSGRKVVADDIKYSFDRQVAQKINAGALPAMKSIEAVNPQTLRITLDGPNIDFLGGLASCFNHVLPHESVEVKGDLKDGPLIGSGPWIFKDWQKGVGSTMLRNPDYWEPGIPYADEVDWALVQDPAAIEAQMRTGAITYSNAGSQGLSPGQAKTMTAPGGGFVGYRSPPDPAYLIHLNLSNPKWQDVRVRKALSMAIDRQLVITNALSGEGQLDMMGMSCRADWLLPQEEMKKLLPFDPKQAKAMLDQTGKPADDELLALNGQSIQVAQLIQSNWKDVGFNTTIRQIDNVELTGSVTNAGVARFSVAEVPILHEPTLIGELEIWYKTGGSRNNIKLSDPKLDGMIQAQKVEFDENKRKGLVQDLQRYIVDNMLRIPLIAVQQLKVGQKNLRNFEPPPNVGEYGHFAFLWFA